MVAVGGAGMSTPINDGGPAFPGFAYTDGRGNQRRNEHSGEWETHEPGMSLRDWFAGQATDEDIKAYLWDSEKGRARPRVEARYAFADAMIAARETKP